MIVPMLHLDLVCVAAEKNAALEKLRALKAVHLDLSSAGGAEVLSVKGEAADAERAVRLILKARGKRDFPVDVRPRSVTEVLEFEADRAKLLIGYNLLFAHFHSPHCFTNLKVSVSSHV